MKAVRGHSGRIEVTAARRHIAGLRATWSAVYQRACKHDKIDATATVVVFSKDNPFVPFVDKAAQMYAEAVRTYQSGGYVGLQMIGGAR